MNSVITENFKTAPFGGLAAGQHFRVGTTYFRKTDEVGVGGRTLSLNLGSEALVDLHPRDVVWLVDIEEIPL